MARIVVPGHPHHVTQRGNRRQQTFFNDGDYQAYIDLMSHWCRQHAVDIWGYCLMPNHVHLIAVPFWANLVQAPERWPWSSAAAHISGRKDDLVECGALLEMVHEDWKVFLMKTVDKDTVEIFRKHERTGKPIGDNDFIEKLEKITGRHLKPRKPGPKPKAVN